VAEKQEPDVKGLSTFLELEAMARNAESEKALQFIIVNESRRLLPYRQAFLLSTGKKAKHKYQVEAASSLSVIDRNAPFIGWLENLVNILAGRGQSNSIQHVDSQGCPEKYRKEWNEYSLPFVLWVPLCLKDDTLLGGLWLTKETPWQDNEITIIKRLASAYAHAWYALTGIKKPRTGGNRRRNIVYGIPAVLVLVCFLPVRLSTIAPVEVVAKEPLIVSAPINGVIADIIIAPNTSVAKGEVIFRYEDTNLRNNYEIAEKALEVSEARLRKATQGAFQDVNSKAQVALLKTEVDLKKTERDFAKELLDQVNVFAEKDGLLIYGDKSDWIGRPVAVGERIMEIADTGSIQLRIDLPVSDAIVLAEGAEVRVFLDIDPLNPVTAEITHASFHAALTPANVLAYRVDAAFVDTVNVRIGLKGSAKIYGNKVSLFFYLFRRPISAMRQFVGL
jgi:hypothetical protein